LNFGEGYIELWGGNFENAGGFMQNAGDFIYNAGGFFKIKVKIFISAEKPHKHALRRLKPEVI